jgi:hypothetical protein
MYLLPLPANGVMPLAVKPGGGGSIVKSATTRDEHDDKHVTCMHLP